MNAQSYLQSYGWTPGTPLGNPLSHLPSSSTSSARLTKRILTSAKNNNLGVGRKASNLNHADLWWEKAFDVSLKNLDVTKDTSTVPSESKNVVDNMNLFANLGGGRGFGGTATAVSDGKNKTRVEVGGPLYRYFVSGGLLEGTIKSLEVATPTPSTATATPNDEAETSAARKGVASKKRKRDDTETSKSERKRLKEERKRLRAERRAAKTERKRLRAERRAAKEEKRKLKAKKKANKEKDSPSSVPKSQESEEQNKDRSSVLSDSGVDISSDEAQSEEKIIVVIEKPEPDCKTSTRKEEKKPKKSKEKSKKKSKV
ncbi:hypothetical protein TWF694_009590 [Orbilia ellipsospora]|uniref:G-patch domain-containing protein n=1 Tax=Orbilia ellipsospora TaxID=2528407 RepID=A0AAV9XBA4_9PEZI